MDLTFGSESNFPEEYFITFPKMSEIQVSNSKLK